MLRHVALFRWSPSTTTADIAAVSTALSALPDSIREIAMYRFGPDAGINEGTFDFAVVADFASLDDYLVYRDHPTHKAVLAERIAPHLADRAAVQYEC
jgi:hypothetical protein